MRRSGEIRAVRGSSSASRRKLQGAEHEVEKVAAATKAALRHAADAEVAYQRADDATRRRWNQAFFRRIFLHDDGAGSSCTTTEASDAELAEPFDALLADQLVEDLETLRASPTAAPRRGLY